MVPLRICLAPRGSPCLRSRQRKSCSAGYVANLIGITIYLTYDFLYSVFLTGCRGPLPSASVLNVGELYAGMCAGEAAGTQEFSDAKAQHLPAAADASGMRRN